MAGKGISQCMIVKNEEKNMEQALGWGRGIVTEQIVVDTGSTDRTVELARSMGAKVYEIPWENDFAAAKNYAISKASCEWIAFLDADEYYTREDAGRLAATLEKISTEYPNKEALVENPLVNLQDDGTPGTAVAKVRVFSRCGSIHYEGKIHEHLLWDDNAQILNAKIPDITIYHTGYTTEAMAHKKTVERNRESLLLEIEREPENPWNYHYLADTYIPESFYKAIEYEKKALSSYETSVLYQKSSKCLEILVPAAGEGLLQALYFATPFDRGEFLYRYEKGSRWNPDYPDVDFWRGKLAEREEDWNSMIFYLEQAIRKAQSYTGGAPTRVKVQMSKLAELIVKAARYQGDTDRILKYSIMGLQLKPYEEKLLLSLLITLLRGTPGEGGAAAAFGFLQKLYNLTDRKNRMFVYKCAKILNNQALITLALGAFTKEEQEILAEEPDEGTMGQESGAMTVRNQADRLFLSTMKELSGCGEEELQLRIKENLAKLPDMKEREAAPLARFLKKDEEQLQKLYEDFADYRSRETLRALITFWFTGDTQMLARVREPIEDICFDLDILPEAKGAVYVDVGAGDGECVQKFAGGYRDYAKLFCFESRQDYVNQLNYALYSFHDAFIKKWDSESEDGLLKMAAELPEDASLLRVELPGREKEFMAAVSDYVWEKHPRFIIRMAAPENITDIVRVICEKKLDYRFYLRYYGNYKGIEVCVLYAV